VPTHDLLNGLLTAPVAQMEVDEDDVWAHLGHEGQRLGGAVSESKNGDVTASLQRSEEFRSLW
jgi:hypothetical protein